MTGIEKSLSTVRAELISKAQGQILDVGSGTGINFQFFDKESKVIAVEPSPFMAQKAKEKLVDFPNITFYLMGVNDEKLNEIISPNSLDYVVCTLVLCTIPEPEKALIHFKKWLKPGGKLLIIEHIHSEKKVNQVLQNIVNPIWKKVGDGCHLNRHTDELISQMGFKEIEKSYFSMGVRFFKGVYEIE